MSDELYTHVVAARGHAEEIELRGIKEPHYITHQLQASLTY